MKIKVTNLGAIKEGEVDLSKNLTVFVGGNNAGKSYMTYLVYGIFKSLDEKSTNNNLFENYEKEAKNFFKKEQIFDEYLNETGIKIDLKKLIKKLDNSPIYFQIWEKTVSNNFPQIFASKKVNPNVSINKNLEFGYANFKEKLNINNIKNIDYDFLIKEDFLFIRSEQHIKENEDLLKSFLCKFFLASVIYDFYFFPAERSAINLFSKEISQQKALEKDAIAKQIQDEDNIEALAKDLKSNDNPVPRYPLAISDYLYFVDDLPHITNQPITEFDDLATEIEQLLEGKVSISEFGNIQFQPKGSQENLALHLSASMIKSLSGLVFYLRHLAKEKDRIIIHEPELNLRPQSQVLITRVLAKMANRGIKIIFSTHSDYIISELSNLLILSQQFDGSEILKQKYGYDNAEILTKDTVNVFAFQNNIIEQIPITEQGIEVDKIEKVITDLNQRSNDIYYSYLESLKIEIID